MKPNVVVDEAAKLRAWSEMLNHTDWPWDAMVGIGTALVESAGTARPLLDFAEAASTLDKLYSLGHLMMQDPRPSRPPGTGVQGLKLIMAELADEMAEIAEWVAEQSDAA